MPAMATAIMAEEMMWPGSRFSPRVQGASNMLEISCKLANGAMIVAAANAYATVAKHKCHTHGRQNVKSHGEGNVGRQILQTVPV
eukprot:SAG31_NODE_5906_length_2263_cov_1.831793_2_plen_85_part_00